MAEETPSLHIDSDWKRQAQEEKKRLAEEEAKKAQKASPTAPAGAPGATAARPAGGRARGEMPPADFSTLVQTLLTQILFHLGDITTRGSEPTVNLDLAKHQIDMLGVLEEKTRNNLTAEEKQLMDTALYESRMRYVSVASQFT